MGIGYGKWEFKDSQKLLEKSGFAGIWANVLRKVIVRLAEKRRCAVVLSGKRSPLLLDARLRSAPLTAYVDREKLPQSARWHTISY